MTASRGHVLSAEQPFPGLRPYGFGDHEYFFGREDQTFALFRLLDRSRFIAVVGASGSGKSSLVRAGLLPLLSKDSASSGGRQWRWAQMRPGVAPLASLADCVASMARQEDAIISAARRDRIDYALRRSSFGLREALGEVEQLDKATIVLVVDQFEELFRFARTGAGAKPTIAAEAWWREEATHFIQLLLGARQEPSFDIHVVITMRSDFIGDCARFHGLPEAVSTTQFLVPSLTRDQLEDVIRKPVEKAKAAIDPELIERLINDSENDLDDLPVLQHCLLRLWDYAGRAAQAGISEQPRQPPPARRLILAHYAAIGGIARALSMHADEILADLEGQELVVEQIFRALSEVDKEGRAIRRALPFSQLLDESGVPEPALRRVLDRFRADDCSFLVPSPAAAPTLAPDTYVDVGHEALLRRWQRVSAEPTETPGQEPDAVQKAGWLRLEEEDGRLYRGLLALARSGDRASQATLPLDQVDRLWAWWTARPRTAAWALRYGGALDLVEALFQRSRRAFKAESERQEALVVAERNAAAARVRRLRYTAIASGLGLLVALILVGLAYWQSTIATAEHERAEKALAVATAQRERADKALAVATAERERADKALAVATAQRERADKALAANFGMMVNRMPVFYDKLAVGSRIRDEVKPEDVINDPAATAANAVAAAKGFVLLLRTAVSADPDDPDHTHFLALNIRQMADIMDLDLRQRDTHDRLDLYRESAQMLDAAVAKRPEIIDWTRDLSVSYDRLGDGLLSDLHTEEAEQAYRKSLDISLKLSSAHPENQQFQNDLMISYEKVGEVLVQQGKRGQAIEFYRRLAEIRQDRLKRKPDDPNFVWAFIRAQAKIADLAADPGDAIQGYRAALPALMGLAKANPRHVQLQWDLLILHDKLGGALTATGDRLAAINSYRAALLVMERLAALAPGPTGFKVNLALRHGRIGDLLKAHGDLTAAAREYGEERALFDQLAKAKPDDTNWQLDLAEINRKIGTVLASAGKRDDAIAAYRLALGIWDHLTKTHPDDASFQRGLLLTNWDLAALGDDSINRLTLVVATLRTLTSDKKLSTDEAEWLAAAEKQLAAVGSK